MPDRSEPRASVLIVDDEPLLRRAISRMLRRAGHRVEDCADGQAALLAIDQSSPDVVILDLHMPGVDGWEVLRELEGRQAPPPVIVMSSHQHREDARGYPFVVDVLDKPVESSELLSVIEAALGAREPA